jgi:hypothetical protein
MGYFVKIENGADTRRLILETSKASIHVLKSYQHLMLVRKQKLELMSSLRRQLKEITIILNQAELLLPALSEKEMQDLLPKKAPIKPPQPKPEEQQVVVPKRQVLKERNVYIGMPKPFKPQQVVPQAAPPPQQKATPDEFAKLRMALAEIEEKLGNI